MSRQQEVIDIITPLVGAVTPDSNSRNTDDWDSLAHLEILDALDAKWPGVTARNPELSSAESVGEIVAILEKDSRG